MSVPTTESKRRILVVDDEPSIRSSLELLLRSNFEVASAESGIEALEVIDTVKPDLVLLDLLMPKLDGIETLKRFRDKQISVPVVMLTGNSTVKTAVEAMKHGAADYLSKPFDVEELTSLIVSLLAQPAPIRGMDDDEERERNSVSSPSTTIEADCGPMVGQGALMRSLFATIKTVAEKDTTVLITGESGTGKELVARRIHDLSPRRNGPFIAINCAAIPETLIESELFGHEKGAFTSAVERRVGYFELADGGTLFLDEIGELNPSVQVKMLRFLQEQEFYRVGRSKPIRVNVRIVCATNQDLERLVIEKRFRQDLLYRINVIPLAIPALRDRFEDIPHLVEHFKKKLAETYGGRSLTFTKEALDLLIQYAWPGNVRELENVIESLMALAPSDEISPSMLPSRFASDAPAGESQGDVFRGNMKFEEAERLFESEMIVKALRKTNYVQTRAAQLLGISRRILKYKMDKLGIKDTPDGDPELTPEEIV